MLFCLIWGTVSAALAPAYLKAPVGLSKRADTCHGSCDLHSIRFSDLARAHVESDEDDMAQYLQTTFRDSYMHLQGKPKSSSDDADPNRIFCNFHVMSTSVNKPGTTFQRCLLETAINDFCTVQNKIQINSTYPDPASNKAGLWTTYEFSGFDQSRLYVGVEMNKSDTCKDHWRDLHFNFGQPDIHCRDKLLEQIVDTCMATIEYDVSADRY